MGSLLFVLLFCEPIDPQIATAIAVAMLDTRRMVEVPVTVEVKAEPTDAEKDAKYLAENHWRLSPGSCGMLGCQTHGGGWVWEPREKIPSRDAVVGTSPGARSHSAPGHWEQYRVGLFRTQRMWVADPTPASPKSKTESVSPTCPPGG